MPVVILPDDRENKLGKVAVDGTRRIRVLVRACLPGGGGWKGDCALANGLSLFVSVSMRRHSGPRSCAVTLDSVGRIFVPLRARTLRTPKPCPDSYHQEDPVAWRPPRQEKLVQLSKEEQGKRDLTGCDAPAHQQIQYAPAHGRRDGTRTATLVRPPTPAPRQHLGHTWSSCHQGDPWVLKHKRTQRLLQAPRQVSTCVRRCWLLSGCPR